MNLWTKIRFAKRASDLVDAIGKIPMPQGINATWIGALTLMLANWLTNAGELFPSTWAPYVSVAIAILSAVHNITALTWGGPGSGWTVSTVRVLIVQLLVITGQCLTQLTAVVPPEWSQYVADGLQTIQAMLSISWLNKEKASI